MSTPTASDLGRVLHFGKYKGLTVGAVLKFNPEYLWWLLQNIDAFRLEPQVREKVRKATIADRQFALNQQDAWAWGFGREAKSARSRDNLRRIKIEQEERSKAAQRAGGAK